MKLPLTIGPIHFVGIGGIGMSGIAEVLHNLGYTVQGSDMAESPNVLRLRDKGIIVHIGHDGQHINHAAVVVVSSAIKRDNPELKAARERRLPVVRRAEMLAELMRLKSSIAIGGTHGKTTTTSLVATLLEAGQLDPTVINGGIINSYGTNARLGDGEWLVAEADESDGTFVKLPAEIAVVTNIDPEHLDHYGTYDEVKKAFQRFVENVPFYGFAVMCTDHPEVQALVGRVEDRRFVTYGANQQADVRFCNIDTREGKAHFEIEVRSSAGSVRCIEGLMLPMPGVHNVSNATAAVCVALELGMTDDEIRRGLANFSGVKRRFTHTGTVGDVQVFDDYAHHPVEISAVLRAARSAAERNVIAIVQPHRYSRLESLFEEFCACFNDADTVVVAPVYPAGEEPIEGADERALAEGLRMRGHRHVLELGSSDQLPQIIHQNAKAGDLVICLGAGSITKWAYELPKSLETMGPAA
ncbi:MAG: UDP-N-acetylmuramate--L-alanine ligase [Hyphomicrobiales bacterium]